MNAKLDTNGRGAWVVRIVDTCGVEVDSIVAAAGRAHAEALWWIDQLATCLGSAGQGDIPTLYGKPRVVAMHGWYVVQEIKIPTTLYTAASEMVRVRKKHYTRELIARNQRAQ